MRDVPRAPGPPGWPIVGNLPDIVRGRLRFIQQLPHKHGEIVRLQVRNHDFYVLSNADYIKHVLVDNAANYVKGRMFEKLHPFLGEGLFTAEGDLWRRQRRLMQPHFHKESINRLGTLMTETIGATIERLRASEDQIVDLQPEMMRLTLDVVTRALFSADVDADAAVVGEALTIVLEHTNERLLSLLDLTDVVPTPTHRRYHEAIKTLDRIVYRIVQARRAGAAQPDLLQMLLDARDPDTGEGMSDAHLRDELMTLFLAGHETTANALSWTWYLLSRNPAVDRTLRREIAAAVGDRTPTVDDVGKLGYARQVFEEAMRLYPPVFSIPRDAVSDDMIGGYRIPAGATVSMSAYLTHHNPRYWSNPEGFDPDRFAADHTPRHPFAYLPFGGGQRKCIGAPFATLEGTLAITMFAQAFRPELVVSFPVVEAPQITLRPSSVNMRLCRASSAS